MAQTTRPEQKTLLGASQRLRTIVSFSLIVLTLALLWEGYKWMGQATGGVWPGTNIGLPVRTNNRAMPHLWDIAAALFRPARTGADEQILLVKLLTAGLFTLRSAFTGFVVGSAFGFTLAIWFIRSPLAERGLMPYVVASQTVPLIAIAPMVVIWGGKAGLPTWISVAIISSYLSFFPVAINGLGTAVSAGHGCRADAVLCGDTAAGAHQAAGPGGSPLPLPGFEDRGDRVCDRCHHR